MYKEVLRTKDGRFCRLEVELVNGRLSICGSAGTVVTRAEAKRTALEYWENFFEDQPEEIFKMNKRLEKRFTTTTGAARFVLKVEGPFHGLDVMREDGDRVWLINSGGQIIDTLRAWFPEVEPYLKWHLNDLHAECEHQEALGWTYATHKGQKCPTCGYEIGTEWKARELPPEVIAWFESLKGE